MTVDFPYLGPLGHLLRFLGVGSYPLELGVQVSEPPCSGLGYQPLLHPQPQLVVVEGLVVVSETAPLCPPAHGLGEQSPPEGLHPLVPHSNLAPPPEE
jgi:hypothetical protein